MGNALGAGFACGLADARALFATWRTRAWAGGGGGCDQTDDVDAADGAMVRGLAAACRKQGHGAWIAMADAANGAMMHVEFDIYGPLPDSPVAKCLVDALGENTDVAEAF